MTTVYISSRAAYFSIKLACSDSDLIGAIIKPMGNMPKVDINAKQCLIDMIAAGGGNFQLPNGFVPANSAGHMSNGAGSGFVGGRSCSSLQAALLALSRYLTLHYCDPVTLKEIELTAQGYRHDRLERVKGGSIYENGGGHVVITVWPPKKPLNPAQLDANCRRLQKRIEDQNHHGNPVREIHVEKSGAHPLPDWFTDWCEENGIAIIGHEPESGPFPDFETPDGFQDGGDYF